MNRKTLKSSKIMFILMIFAMIAMLLPMTVFAEEAADVVEEGVEVEAVMEEPVVEEEEAVVEEEAVEEAVEEEEAVDEAVVEEEAVEEEVVSEPSAWAVEEIEKAKEYNLVTEKVLSDFQKDITREEFCELAVKLYEALSGEEAMEPEENVFTDTENPEVLKANALGIVNGVSATEFAPEANITRQEIALMFYRTLNAVDAALTEGTYEVSFADKDQIADWALEAVAFMSNKGILGGVGDNLVNPLGNATSEQAIALVVRAFENASAEATETEEAEADETEEMEETDEEDAEVDETEENDEEETEEAELEEEIEE